MHQMLRLTIPPLHGPLYYESVARAKADQLRDRAEVEKVTRGRFVGDTLIVPEPAVPRIVLSCCTVHGCLYVAGGKSEGEALLKLESHLQRTHGVTAPREVA